MRLSKNSNLAVKISPFAKREKVKKKKATEIDSKPTF